MIHVYIKAFLLKMDLAKCQTVRSQITNVNPLLQYYRLFQLLLQPYAEHEGIITKVYHRFNHRFRYTSISSC